MGTLGQHESFGEIAAFKGATRAATVVCLVPTELLSITRSVLQTHQPIERDLAGNLSTVAVSTMASVMLTISRTVGHIPLELQYVSWVLAPMSYVQSAFCLQAGKVPERQLKSAQQCLGEGQG